MTEWGNGTRILKCMMTPSWFHSCTSCDIISDALWSSALFNSHRLHVFLCTREKRAQQKNV